MLSTHEAKMVTVHIMTNRRSFAEVGCIAHNPYHFHTTAFGVSVRCQECLLWRIDSAYLECLPNFHFRKVDFFFTVPTPASSDRITFLNSVHACRLSPSASGSVPQNSSWLSQCTLVLSSAGSRKFGVHVTQCPQRNESGMCASL